MPYISSIDAFLYLNEYKKFPSLYQELYISYKDMLYTFMKSPEFFLFFFSGKSGCTNLDISFITLLIYQYYIFLKKEIKFISEQIEKDRVLNTIEVPFIPPFNGALLFNDLLNMLNIVVKINESLIQTQQIYFRISIPPFLLIPFNEENKAELVQFFTFYYDNILGTNVHIEIVEDVDA